MRMWLRIVFYVVILPLTLIYMYFSFPVTYTHYRSVFLAQMNRVYKKEQREKTAVQMAELGSRVIPGLPASEGDLTMAYPTQVFNKEQQ